MPQSFSGFPQEGLAFLQGLAANNNRDWFEAHKQDFVRYLQEPAVEFIVTLGERLKTISKGIHYDTRTNGAGSLMRIQRDTRFSPDKTPYKSRLALMFWEGSGRKTESPAFGMHFNAVEGNLMAGMHGFPKAALQKYRQAVDDESLGAELVKAIATVQQAGDYEVGDEEYKRVPAGFATDHPRADLLRYGGLYAFGPSLDAAALTSPALVDVCFAHFRSMAPIQQWLVKAAVAG